jgi:hypothetical protein
MNRDPIHRAQSRLPVHSMMWALDDASIEDAARRVRALEDIQRAGFDGVTVFVRGGRSCWLDPEAIDALAHISAWTAAHGMIFWLGTDPRFISRHILHGGGKRMIVCGDATVPRRVPLLATVTDGRFLARCRIVPRAVHTMNEAAVTFHPIELSHARLFDASAQDGVDVTGQARFFHDALRGQVEAFGRLDRNPGSRARIAAFFLFETNHFDYASQAQLDAYARALAALSHAGVDPAMIVWDEPGYPCIDGCYPVPGIEPDRGTRRDSLSRELWRLTRNAESETARAFATRYYSMIQDEVTAARAYVNAALRRARIPWSIGGIHDTWRWESADVADRLHGSLDIWRSGADRRAGFVDLGSAQLLRDPGSDFHAHLAGISAAAIGLGRRAREGVAYDNLWTAGEARWQSRVLSHCIDATALFGLRWIAHIYGPAGVHGASSSFLGLADTPGYPDHSTWSGMGAWTARLRRHDERTGGRLPEVDATIVFPLETLYAHCKREADAMFGDLFRLVLFLTDHHLTVEFCSPDFLRRNAAPATIRIVPFPTRAAERRSVDTVLYYDPRGVARAMPGLPSHRFADTHRGVLALVRAHLPEAAIEAPARCWVTRTRIADGHLVTLAPSRSGYRYQGRLVFHGSEIRIPPQRGLLRVILDEHCAPLAIEEG